MTSGARTERSGTPRRGPQAPGRGAGSFLRKLGPGLITGAADDDPAGIATYSQAGAGYGYGLLWTTLVTLPLMSAVQLMCARIGLVAKEGLAAVLREHYPRWTLWLACTLLAVGNTINIAADLSGMAAAASLLTGIPRAVFVPVLAALILALLVYASYAAMTRVLKWMALALFAYVGAGLLARADWSSVIRATLIPLVPLTGDGLLMLVAIFGTTISPYLFFWQAAQTAEQWQHVAERFPYRRRRAVSRELRDTAVDTYAGMGFSQLIMYFIILTAGATLHPAGITTVTSADQAAQALRPLAGALAAWLFTFGVVGTGMLAVPVLAGSAAYAVAEAGGWERGMDERPRAAREFYAVMGIAMIAGTLLALLRVNPIRLLVWSAVLNGLLAPPLVVIILVVCNNRKVMGRYRNGRALNLLGGATAVIMSAAAVALVLALLLRDG